MSIRSIEARKIAVSAEEKLNNFIERLLAGENLAESGQAGVVIGRFIKGDYTYTAHIIVTKEKSESCPTTGSKTS